MDKNYLLLSRIRVNGCCSDFFLLKRGVRQGDCLSPLLFAISIELLAESIRHNKDICGITDDGRKEHKISLFVDDILAFIRKPSSSIPALLKDLDQYGKILSFLTSKIYCSDDPRGEASCIRGKSKVSVDQERG